ncbi:helix-turn-helix domain-containing protein [Actinomadura decatromicini]|uniref:Helix-turn-helix domain-containing protein n=1 Tax=Actinomadura decatromicini TaxID=2604572 RepID=A0A5D3F7Z7_9ACTN|nr:helix-turn-helix transcriptional regulator [Actinomadura decatromicini]TYK45137.1 helix-turn-helix domain-containing protein [Actinomadura decatromicini]
MTSPPYIPSVRARSLGRRLREAREAADIRVGAAAASLGWSQGKVSHIESGRNRPSERDVELLLDLYGVRRPQRDELLALAREVDRRGWWNDYTDVLHGPYVALEDAAHTVLGWAPQVVPGLLQTPEYATEIMRIAHTDDEDVERRVRARVQRQLLLTRPSSPASLHVVLSEQILHNPVGGPDVMRDQLYRLVSEAHRPNVTLQILETASGAHAGLEGMFIVLKFPAPDPDVAYVEGVHGVVYLESPQTVADCNVRFESLHKQALDSDASAELIKAVARSM